MIVGIREMSRPEAFISVTDIDGRHQATFGYTTTQMVFYRVYVLVDIFSLPRLLWLVWERHHTCTNIGHHNPHWADGIMDFTQAQMSITL